MQLQQWLNYIQSIHHKEIELGLQRVSQVASRLNVLSFPCPVITVAGTNGKGTCVKTLDTITRQAGYRVASYTSPHLMSFNERIQLQGHPVRDEVLCNAFEKVESARGNISLSFFEFTTLAAFVIFKELVLDLIILEVGLGGRLDAVNIIDADIAVITSISLDHTDRLGNTREAIGFEKAGILRAGSPAICGDYSIPNSVLSKAEQLHIPLYRLGYEFNWDENENSWSWYNHEIAYKDLPLPNLELQNVATALQALNILNKRLPILENSIRNGLQGLDLAGRFTVITRPIKMILDVAHNPAGGVWLAKRLMQQRLKGRLLAVVAMLSDKDQRATLNPLTDIIAGWFVADLAVPRGGKAAMLSHTLTSLGVANIHQYPSVIHAYQAAKMSATQDDTIIIFGSFHTVGEVMSYLKENKA